MSQVKKWKYFRKVYPLQEPELCITQEEMTELQFLRLLSNWNKTNNAAYASLAPALKYWSADWH